MAAAVLVPEITARGGKIPARGLAAPSHAPFMLANSPQEVQVTAALVLAGDDADATQDVIRPRPEAACHRSLYGTAPDLGTGRQWRGTSASGVPAGRRVPAVTKSKKLPETVKH